MSILPPLQKDMTGLWFALLFVKVKFILYLSLAHNHPVTSKSNHLISVIHFYEKITCPKNFIPHPPHVCTVFGSDRRVHVNYLHNLDEVWHHSTTVHHGVYSGCLYVMFFFLFFYSS